MATFISRVLEALQPSIHMGDSGQRIRWMMSSTVSTQRGAYSWWMTSG